MELEVLFDHARWRHFGWMAFGLVTGLILIAKLGAVAQVVGGILAALGLFNAYGFVRTLLHPAGRIAVRPDEVVLSDGLCRGVEEVIPRAEIKHAFFLRRAAPWLRSGPMLVVETADRSFAFPRDWFGSDADQRRIAEALQAADSTSDLIDAEPAQSQSAS